MGGLLTMDSYPVVVLISANAEWQAVRELFPEAEIQHSPFGEWFVSDVSGIFGEISEPVYFPDVLFFQGGWGKISAAASTQYAIDCWSPQLLVNLGTCGGFEGEVDRNTIILVERTIVYDLIEQMADHEATIAHYTTELDLTWLREPYPLKVKRTLIVSGDRDLLASDIPMLTGQYGAVAGDWESGSIAWVAKRNQTRCLILRGVSDMVGQSGGEAYQDIEIFYRAARQIMTRLVQALPAWIVQGVDQP